MAKGETFLLVSLKEDEAKKLAQVISNDASRRILNFLAAKNATESELAKDLNMPISTVHYNLGQLLKTGLVETKEYHYSEKGKEVNHYSLSKKYIIIAPSTLGIKSRLKGILPMALITLVGAGLIHFFSRQMAGTAFGTAKAAEQVMMASAEAAPAITQPAAGLPVSLWFLLGGICVIAVYIIIGLIKRGSR